MTTWLLSITGAIGRRRGAIRPSIMLVALSTILPAVAAAQGAVDPAHGLLFVDQQLRGLGSVKRVLVIGAHPDDEDNSLLSVLARGYGADAAYLSLNRGEGGQNLIGPELGVGLGLVRTGELLAARRIDGTRQFFTRAYDFGYSKSPEEAFRFWPRDSLLADVVYVIRRFRPQVIVFEPPVGHGQHQAAGILAQEAFDAAGDPTRFAGQLAEGVQPWVTSKLYQSARFASDDTTLAVNTGELDLLLGRSYYQIAMASRSQHRSQDMGRIEPLGPSQTQLQLLQTRVGGERGAEEASPFDGLDTTYAGLLSSIPGGEVPRRLSQELTAYQHRLDDCRAALLERSGELVERLGQALQALRQALRLTEDLPAAHTLRVFLQEDETDLQAALAEAAGVIVEAFASDDLIVPGQVLEIEVQIWNGGREPVLIRSLGIRAPEGWAIEPDEPGEVVVPPDSLSERHFHLSVPENAEPTRPYFLRRPRSAGVYAWPKASPERATPLGTPLIEADAELVIGGHIVRRSLEAINRFGDQARGEVRRPLFVVPEVAVSLTPGTVVWPLDRVSPVSLAVSLRAEAEHGAQGRVWLEVPDGWNAEPANASFALAGPGRTATLDFEVAPTGRASAEAHYVRAWAETASGRRLGLGYSVIEYPHIRRNLLFEEAVARIEAFELKVDKDVRVAYVPGAGDAIGDAMTAMGVPVAVLDESAVASGDLSGFDVIVLGIRAYETNPALVAGNERFLEWVRLGGVLIVQYQQYGYFDGDFAPYPLQAQRPHDRVTDETASVRILSPDHELFNQPNRIGAADFEGWVQERGLYFPHEWDERYEPLLEMSDPGEDPKRGALLVAEYGEGIYVYTGLSLFRQLPAGVPGAYRILANLLSLGR